MRCDPQTNLLTGFDIRMKDRRLKRAVGSMIEQLECRVLLSAASPVTLIREPSVNAPPPAGAYLPQNWVGSFGPLQVNPPAELGIEGPIVGVVSSSADASTGGVVTVNYMGPAPFVAMPAGEVYPTTPDVSLAGPGSPSASDASTAAGAVTINYMGPAAAVPPIAGSVFPSTPMSPDGSSAASDSTSAIGNFGGELPALAPPVSVSVGIVSSSSSGLGNFGGELPPLAPPGSVIPGGVSSTTSSATIYTSGGIIVVPQSALDGIVLPPGGENEPLQSGSPVTIAGPTVTYVVPQSDIDRVVQPPGGMHNIGPESLGDGIVAPPGGFENLPTASVTVAGPTVTYVVPQSDIGEVVQPPGGMKNIGPESLDGGIVQPPGGIENLPTASATVPSPAVIYVVPQSEIDAVVIPPDMQNLDSSSSASADPNGASQNQAAVVTLDVAPIVVAQTQVVAAMATHNLGTSVLITDANLTNAARLDGNEMKAPRALLASLMDSRVMAVLALTLAAANYRKGRRAGAMGGGEASEMES